VIIYPPDHPLVVNGTYDQEGYKPGERARIAKAWRKANPHYDVHAGRLPERKTTMRFFDDDKVGCYLDDIGHRVEKTKDGNEIKMVDLTLRVQPFTPELAVSLDPDVRSLLFNLTDATAKAKIKALHFNLITPRQALAVYLLPESLEGIQFSDVEITEPRARTEKGVDGYGLVFYASLGPVSAGDLEYICNWHTQQRFITFQPQEPALNFAGAAGDDPQTPEPARRTPRRNPKPATTGTNQTEPGQMAMAGDELRPGTHAEH
jgi:hypothetical protein